MSSLALARRSRTGRATAAVAACVVTAALLLRAAPSRADRSSPYVRMPRTGTDPALSRPPGAERRTDAQPQAPRSLAQQPVPGPIGSLFATSPLAVITTTVTISNTLDAPHVVGVAVDPVGGDNAWPVRSGPGRLLQPGASARVPVTVEVPIAAVDGMRMAARLYVRAATETDAPVTVEERTLYAWTGGDMTRVTPNAGATYVGCRGDLDSDGLVHPYEVDVVASRFAARRGEGGYDPTLDFDHDGRIGAADVQAVAGRAGRRCGPLEAVDSAALREAVAIEPIRGHLEALQAAADANGGNRAAGTAGYDASVRYMAAVLEDAGYRDVRSAFERLRAVEPMPAVIEVHSPDAVALVPGIDFRQAAFSGGGEVTADIVPVDVTVPPAPESSSTSGCEREDFEGFPRGAVALMQRGTCNVSQKALNAVSQGAVAAIIFNEGQPDRTDPFPITLGPSVFAIPVFATRFGVGEAIVRHVRSGTTVRVHIKAEAAAAIDREDNIVAEWPFSDDDSVVMIGAHLDSVRSGPGINDNGSGAAAVVEIARQVARLDLRPRHRLKFALWGAEEVGGWGARRYLERLSPTEHHRIIAYLNFDMIGSVNPMRDVYPATNAPDGSDELSALFGRWFQSRGVPYEETPIVGSLDSDAFDWVGIPASGLFTGHNMMMTPEQAGRYKGTAGAPMDPCYHAPCDTITNINLSILDEMADAAAHATWSAANAKLLALTSRRALPLPSQPGRQALEAAQPSIDARVNEPAGARPMAGMQPSASVAQLPDEVIAVAVDTAGMAASEVTLSYDPLALAIMRVESGDFVPQNSLVLGPVLAPGVISFGSAGADVSTTGTGRIAHIRFRRLRGSGPPVFRIDHGATGTYDAAGTRLPAPATVRLAGAAVTGVWLPWGGMGR